MRGRSRTVEFALDPEIEKTAKANRKAARLAHSAEPGNRRPHIVPNFPELAAIPSPVKTMGDAVPPPRPLMGDYGLAANRGHLTHVFQPANPVAFDIKTSVHNGLKENQYDGTDAMCPHQHLSAFYETCQFCTPPATVTEDQKKLRLFAFTLTGRAKDWLLSLPSGTIRTWAELELKFLARFFPMHKYMEKKSEITSFKQGESESLYDAWERFKLMLKRCPAHDLSEKDQMQIFTEGLTQNHKMLLDASAGGTMRLKTDLEVQTLVENMAQNEHRVNKEKKKGVFGVSESSAILANQALIAKQLEALTKHVLQQPNTQLVASISCDFCGGLHANGECVPEGESEEANYMGNYQRNNPYSNTYNPGYAKHPNLSYSNTNTLNPLLPNPQQQPRKPSAFEEFVKMTKQSLDEIKATQEAERKNNEASRKMFETQIGQMAKQLAEQSKGGFSGNTKDNPKNESCNAITLRSKKVLPPLVPKKGKSSEVVVEKENGVVEKDDDVEVIVEKEKEHGGVENTKSDGVVEKEKSDDEKYEPLIDEGSILRKTKSQLLKDGDKPQEVPSYVKLPYPHLSKKKKNEEGQFKKFMELFSQLQVNIPFGEALDQMPVYAKFMKDLLTGRRKPKDDENIALSENCSAILQRKLPPKLKDPGAFTIPCTIGKVDVGRALCDLGASINLMPLSMMKKLGCGEPKPTRMTLTLADRSISFPYGILEDVLVKVDGLLFPADFVILDMAEDEDMPLLLGRPFLATGRALIDVELGELMLRFQNEHVVFNIFEAMKHQTENPQCYRVEVGETPVEDQGCKVDGNRVKPHLGGDLSQEKV